MMRYLLVLLVAACPAVAADLKVATWNLNWLTLRPAGDPILPRTVGARRPQDWTALRRYAMQLDADVVAFQEVDGPNAAAEVFPADRYQIFMTGDDVVQRTGFAVKRALTVERNPDLVGLDVYPNARFRLRSGADITITLPGGKLRLLDVHLKTGCHEDSLTSNRQSCQTLRRQVAPLQGWIAQRRSEGVPFVVAGDFNRVMDGHDDLLAALSGPTPLARATENQSTPCWGGNTFIDHIIAGGAARTWMLPTSLKVLVYRETDPADKERLSDHCPVSIRFRVPD